MTTPDSFRNRLNIMLSEFERLNPVILADKQRLHDIEQKRILFFRQQGICPECKKPLEFKTASGPIIQVSRLRACVPDASESHAGSI